ncbi:glutathione transferase GST 23-like [Macadamia integrifolia]|uniref:glutathione transferase GST 23-like n=1 Tax=Macadamia integrifolia TaxID=60698 RepID=UPI001C4EAA42|nr:glutathione transferase GST 23-like [Macadamia integrifolia]
MEDKIPIFYALALFIQGEEQDKAIKDCLELLRTIEKQGLEGDRKFFGGTNISLTDLVFGLMAYHWEVIEEIVGVNLMETHSFPRLNAWAENFKSVSVIKESLPDRDILVARLKERRDVRLGVISS